MSIKDRRIEAVEKAIAAAILNDGFGRNYTRDWKDEDRSGEPILNPRILALDAVEAIEELEAQEASDE